MPAHITHTLFAQQVIEKALGTKGKQLFSRFESICTLGAQGPDMFLHNFRTEPSGFRYGKLLHTSGYGRFIKSMAEKALEKGAGTDSAEAGFILAYTSHAFLDRSTHPFIIYFSGWVDPKKPETQKYHQCHPYFERIIDVFTLRKFTSIELSDYDFRTIIDCGDTLPGVIDDLLCSGLTGTFRIEEPEGIVRKKIGSSYTDTMYTYSLTNPPDLKNREKAYRQDVETGYRNRLLALFHPRELGTGIDFLNLGGSVWRNPCMRGGERNESFWELYEEAYQRVVPVLRYIAEVLEGRADSSGIEGMVGNVNLSGGKSERPCTPKGTNPHPFPELIRKLYDGFQPV